MTSRATAREAVSEPDVLIWTSKGRIQASKLVNLEHKWLEEDDTFMIKVDGEWVEAQSIDFNFEKHYDVFGLIDSGLAVDINKIQSHE